jgi:hypothetical protein
MPHPLERPDGANYHELARLALHLSSRDLHAVDRYTFGCARADAAAHIDILETCLFDQIDIFLLGQSTGDTFGPAC